MHDQNCIFCKIIAGQIPGKIIYQTELSIVLQDIAPQAQIHYLIIPKQHIQDLVACTDKDILVDLMSIPTHLSQLVGQQQNIDPVDFKLITNNGYAAGQRVFHLHFHFLSGKTFSE
jgi:histidine triad (HIT) family protein